MDKRVVKTGRTFIKNVVKHVKWVLLGRESWRDARDGIAEDGGKLKRVMKGKKYKGDHQLAARLVEKGRRAYNERRFESAENFFRQAIIEDPVYGLAYTYLGSTLYKQQRIGEATTMWMRAIQIDPASEAAAKAQQRLSRVKQRKDAYISTLEQDLGLD